MEINESNFFLICKGLSHSQHLLVWAIGLGCTDTGGIYYYEIVGMDMEEQNHLGLGWGRRPLGTPALHAQRTCQLPSPRSPRALASALQKPAVSQGR